MSTIYLGGYEMEPAGQQRPDVVFRCDTQAFVLLVYGRIPLADTVADGRIKVSGDSRLAEQFGH